MTIEGRAWSGFGPVERVEFSADGGESGRDADLGDALGPHGWTSWSSDWDARPGEYELCARATDASGKRSRSMAKKPGTRADTGSTSSSGFPCESARENAKSASSRSIRSIPAPPLPLAVGAAVFGPPSWERRSMWDGPRLAIVPSKAVGPGGVGRLRRRSRSSRGILFLANKRYNYGLRSSGVGEKSTC